MKKVTPKLYPFSMTKHAHDIEFRRNRAFNESDWTLFETLTELLQAMKWNTKDGKITFLSGKHIGLAKETVAWAEEQRSS